MKTATKSGGKKLAVPKTERLLRRFLYLVRLTDQVEEAVHDHYASGPVETEAINWGLKYARAMIAEQRRKA